MKLKSSLILLSLAVIAASCSKNHYAQVEPDDLYFTHKDRKAAMGTTIIPSSPTVTSVEPVETPTEYERSEYSDQHSPVFTTPTYGSPTIQQYGQKPYYDTSVNPDYLYEDEYGDVEGSSQYYDENYSYQAPPAYETPQVNNYYYGLPSSNYYPSSAWLGASYYPSYNPFRYGSGSYYGYNPYGWNDPYNSWYYPSYSYMGGYGSYNGYWNDPYYGSSWGSPYCGWVTTIYGGNSNYYNNPGPVYTDNNPKVVTKPRQSRNQVSYEVDKSNLPIKSRRADYVPSAGKESGRIATNSSGRVAETADDSRSSYTRRGSSVTYYTSTEPAEAGRYNKRNNSATVQDRSRNANNSQQRNRTVVVPTRSRTNYVVNSNQQQGTKRTSNANRSSVNRNSSNNRTAGTSRYSTRTTNANRSSYNNRSSSGSRSNSSVGTRTRSNSSGSAGSRSSYSSGRSSSRSYSAPSRSSGSSGRSYSAPSRSSSSGSSGTRSSSGRSSSGRSSVKKN